MLGGFVSDEVLRGRAQGASDARVDVQAGNGHRDIETPQRHAPWSVIEDPAQHRVGFQLALGAFRLGQIMHDRDRP